MAVFISSNKFESILSSPVKKPSVTVEEVSLPPTPPLEIRDEPFWFGNQYKNPHENVGTTESTSVVAVIGVGYVGVHLVKAFSRCYNVIAFDLSEKRLQEISSQLKGLPIHFTTSAIDLSQASHVLISVPTILREDKSVDTTCLCSAIATVDKYVNARSTVVIESSVAVGMTRKLVGPLMASKYLKVGMSPERVDPGRMFPAFENIPKIVSGLDAASLESISQLYGRVFRNLLCVSSPEVAEMTKLYENCQRMVCVAYANEMADACATIGIDAFEVSQAAASKPFGYLPFQPGPGVGGHCIPVNPYYLLSTCSMPLLEHATIKSWQRPTEVTRRFVQSLLEEKAIKYSAALPKANHLRILVVGVGFKRGQSIMSNSPGASIINTLRNEYNLHAEFADPLVSADLFDLAPKFDTKANWNTAQLCTFDGIIIAVDQIGLDMKVLAQLQGVKIHDYSGCLRNLCSVVV